MKKFLPILLLLLSTVAFGQTKKELMAQKWKLDKVEDFGQLYDPMDNQKGDWIEFTNDGKFTGIIEGLHVEGTWSATNAAVVKIDKTKSKLAVNWSKVKTVEKTKLSIEYQNGDLITSTLIFVPQK